MHKIILTKWLYCNRCRTKYSITRDLYIAYILGSSPYRCNKCGYMLNWHKSEVSTHESRDH